MEPIGGGGLALTTSTVGFVRPDGEVAGSTIAVGDQSLGRLAGDDKLVSFSGSGDVFQGTKVGLNGDTISGFGGNPLADKIDETDLLPTAWLTYTGNTAQGTLALSGSTQITMVGNFVQSGFHTAADGHTESFIAYS